MARNWVVVSSCEHCNIPSGCIKYWDFLDKLNVCKLLRNVPVTWNSGKCGLIARWVSSGCKFENTMTWPWKLRVEFSKVDENGMCLYSIFHDGCPWGDKVIQVTGLLRYKVRRVVRVQLPRAAIPDWCYLCCLFSKTCWQSNVVSLACRFTLYKGLMQLAISLHTNGFTVIFLCRVLR